MLRFEDAIGSNGFLLYHAPPLFLDQKYRFLSHSSNWEWDKICQFIFPASLKIIMMIRLFCSCLYGKNISSEYVWKSQVLLPHSLTRTLAKKKESIKKMPSFPDVRQQVVRLLAMNLKY